MVPKDAVASELVQNDTPIGGDTDRMGKVAGIGEGEYDRADAIVQGISATLGVDDISQRAMVDRDRERGAVKVARDVEAGVPHHAEKSVAMVISIGGSKIVRPRDVREIERAGLGRRGDGRRRNIRQLDKSAHQALLSAR